MSRQQNDWAGQALLSIPHHRIYRFAEAVLAWEDHLLQIRGERDGCVEGCYALDGCIEIFEAFLGDESGDLGSEAGGEVVFVEDDDAVGLSDGREYRFFVERDEGAEVEDFNRNGSVAQALSLRPLYR